MRVFFIVSLLLLAIVILFCFFWLKSKTKICVRPQKALLDQPIEISVSNLAKHQEVSLELSCQDEDKNIWLSRATFVADNNGVVNVAKQAPTSGSYRGIDPMGLFWSMVPTNKDASKHFMSKITLNLCEVTLSVFAQDKLLVQKIIYRLPISPNIEKIKVREPVTTGISGITGTLFYPKNMTKRPGVIVIPGSNGGIPENISQMLASHGYTVLALGYFGVEGLPKTLSNIPLEYFQNAIQWFKKQPQVDENRVAIMGVSRGGELVLLLGATFPSEIAAVIAYAPSSLVNGDFAPEEKPAWTYKGAPVPFMPNLSVQETMDAAQEGLVPMHLGTLEDPLEEVDVFLYAMKKYSQKIESSTIPVENIHCPLLIVTGENDKMWPATLHGKLILERLDKCGSTIKRKHISYYNAGHNLFIFPNVPSIDLPVSFGPVWGMLGGTAEANAKAVKESWAEVLDFLGKTLHEKNAVEQKSEWFNQVHKEFAVKNSGQFLAKDKTGKELLLEWKKADIVSPDNAETMQEVWETIRDAYIPIEMGFLKAHPEVVGSDTLFKAYEPFFKNGLEKVDWKLVEEKIEQVLKSCVIFDVSNLSAEIKKVLSESVHIFVFAKDKETGKKLGFIEFYVSPENRQGDVKCTMFAVVPEAQNRGLGKLLMSSILKILPQTKRIYLSTRITNDVAQKAYLNWGFVKDVNPVYQEGGFTYKKEHWMFFEYKTSKSDILQKVADGLTIV